MIEHHGQRSVMAHEFSQIPETTMERSNFRRSHGYKSTFDSGYLIPIYVDEALPGDTFRLNMSSVARLATPIYPLMDNLHMDFFFFAVPNRLLWNHWQQFCGEKTNPGDSTVYELPYLESPASTGWAIGSLADYFGLPTGVAGLQVSALHFRAYNLIYNEWFRDQNLINSLTVQKDEGPDNNANYVLRKRCKRHDYFTSCLPWPQKGAGVELPLGTTAPVVGNTKSLGLSDGTTTYGLYRVNGEYALYCAGNKAGTVKGDTTAPNGVEPAAPKSIGVSGDGNYSGLVADLSSATAATINSLREAFQLQRMMERDARGGTRYTEILRSHFGVESPDGRLQRPEYLGGGSTDIVISPIAQTSESATTKQGHLAAIGYQSHSGIGFTKAFVEHCVLIGLVNVWADLTYQRGIDRMWSRRTRYDFYWPALAHLGEQEVLKKEIYAAGTSADSEVFGYQERWAEYRYAPSKITGKFRSVDPGSLDAWHLSQDFGSCPALNQSFIEEAPPVDRVVAVTTEPQFIFDAFFDVMCTRPMPTYSVPGLIDHF